MPSGKNPSLGISEEKSLFLSKIGDTNSYRISDNDDLPMSDQGSADQHIHIFPGRPGKLDNAVLFECQQLPQGHLATVNLGLHPDLQVRKSFNLPYFRHKANDRTESM